MEDEGVVGTTACSAGLAESVTLRSSRSSRDSKGSTWTETSDLHGNPASPPLCRFHSGWSGCSSLEAPASPQSSPECRHAQGSASQSPAAATPIAHPLRRSAMWLGLAPSLPNVEALTPVAPACSDTRRCTSLATARDQFKMSIGARERSRQFRSAVLSELGTLAASPAKLEEH